MTDIKVTIQREDKEVKFSFTEKELREILEEEGTQSTMLNTHFSFALDAFDNAGMTGQEIMDKYGAKYSSGVDKT